MRTPTELLFLVGILSWQFLDYVARLFFCRIFHVARLVHQIASHDVPPKYSENQEQPENVEGLQNRKEGECDDLADPAFILLSFPVKFIWSNGSELCENSPEDS